MTQGVMRPGYASNFPDRQQFPICIVRAYQIGGRSPYRVSAQPCHHTIPEQVIFWKLNHTSLTGLGDIGIQDDAPLINLYMAGFQPRQFVGPDSEIHPENNVMNHRRAFRSTKQFFAFSYREKSRSEE